MVALETVDALVRTSALDLIALAGIPDLYPPRDNQDTRRYPAWCSSRIAAAAHGP
jgi:hypothetical protein